MKLSLRRIAVAAALIGSATGADAVSISANGSGQALILPYYTVNGGNSTLLSLRNNTAAVKAVHVNFREGRNGAAVLSFNIYLAPRDVWTASITGGADGPALISSSDKSCTVPALPSGSQPFQNFGYSGTNADGGPYDLERTREGFVELIEMGELFDDANGSFKPASAATPPRLEEAETAPGNCPALIAAWSIGGHWHTEPHRNLRSPSGGLSANAVIVNVAQGNSFSMPSVALQDFFSPAYFCAPTCDGIAGENLHNDPGYTVPDLSSARDSDGNATARIEHQGQTYRFSFSGEDAGARAVSALLMRATLYSEFNTAQSEFLRAESEWVVTQPTRHLLLNNAEWTDRLPFIGRYHDPNRPPFAIEGACQDTELNHVGRDGRVPGSGITFLPPPSPPRPRLCFAAHVFAFNQDRVGDYLHGLNPSRVLGARYASSLRTCQYPFPQNPNFCDNGPVLDAGSARLEISEEYHFLAASPAPIADNPGGANLLTGLPMVGFWVSRFEASGTPGVLANFAVQQTLSGEVSPHAGTVQSGTGGSWTPVP